MSKLKLEPVFLFVSFLLFNYGLFLIVYDYDCFHCGLCVCFAANYDYYIL